MKNAVLFVLRTCSLGDISLLYSKHVRHIKEESSQSLRLLQCVGLMKLSSRAYQSLQISFCSSDFVCEDI